MDDSQNNIIAMSLEIIIFVYVLVLQQTNDSSPFFSLHLLYRALYH